MYPAVWAESFPTSVRTHLVLLITTVSPPSVSEDSPRVGINALKYLNMVDQLELVSTADLGAGTFAIDC